MTEKLFYLDGRMKEFTAEVMDLTIDGDQCKAVLNRTAFFPEGGGQSGDIGWIEGIRVVDTKEQGDTVYHYLEKNPNGAFAVGDTVQGKLDFAERFSRMQQHSGEHIISGIVHSMFGYDNVGFHLGDDAVTMDFNGEYTEADMLVIEEKSNDIVFQNLPIETTYPTKEELKILEYRSKIEIEGQVRIITIPGVDVCACCAPHLNFTGEIGLIKMVDLKRHRGGMRMTMVCGKRALMDYRMKEANVRQISAALSVPVEQTAQRVEVIKKEQIQLKTQMENLQREVLAGKVEAIPEGEALVMMFEDGIEGNVPRELMNLILQKQAGVAAVFAGSELAGYRYVIGSKSVNLQGIAKALNQQFSGRGGGKPEMVQGSITGSESEIRALMLQQLQESSLS